jgi:hypothetical protein
MVDADIILLISYIRRNRRSKYVFTVKFSTNQSTYSAPSNVHLEKFLEVFQKSLSCHVI